MSSEVGSDITITEPDTDSPHTFKGSFQFFLACWNAQVELFKRTYIHVLTTRRENEKIQKLCLHLSLNFVGRRHISNVHVFEGLELGSMVYAGRLFKYMFVKATGFREGRGTIICKRD